MDLHQQFDQNNIILWQNRYSNPPKNYSDSQELLINAQKEDYHKGVAYAKLNMAMACFLQSKNREAFELIGNILEYFYENREEIGYLWTLNLQASLFEAIADYEKALSIALKAIKHSKDREESELEADIASVIGLVYTRLCNFDKAIEYYKTARDIRKSLNDLGGLASSLNRLGMICRLTGNYDKAIEYYNQSLEIRKANGLESAIPWTMLGIASTYEEMNSLEKALNFYQKGLIDSDKRCALQCEMGIGRIYSKTSNVEKAEQTLLKALKMAEEVNANALVAEIQLALSNHYEAHNNPLKAFQAYKNYQQTKEKVMNEEAKNRLQNIEISHAIEKSEQEKEIFRLRNVELKAAYEIIEEKNRDITSSITYARYIQQAILPDPNEIKWLVDYSFILYMPKDIVSGDFYWFTEKDGKTIIAAADCTGHGVPGALMSMLGVSMLEEVVNKRNITDANQILDNLRNEVIRSLKQTNTDSKSKDGMDISLCVIDNAKNSIQYAGAYNSLYFVRNHELTEYKADKMPIGVSHNLESSFTCNTISVKSKDMLYISSDGFADQFGGADGKKFMARNLKVKFTEIASLPLDQQKSILENEHINWKGENKQVDDVLVIGIRIP
jgi:serine phosphatase RsbU (regulator of sigma subunit)